MKNKCDSENFEPIKYCDIYDPYSTNSSKCSKCKDEYYLETGLLCSPIEIDFCKIRELNFPSCIECTNGKGRFKVLNTTNYEC